MASLAAAQVASPDQSHTIVVRSSYQRDDWRRLQLNDAVEDVLSKILRFGFDIDRVVVKPATAKTLCGQVLTWAKHIACEILSYTDWKENYDFTFEVLYTPDAVPSSDDTPIGTEADLFAELQDVGLERDYALHGMETEKEHLVDHDLSLRKARTRQDILSRIAARYSTTNPMPPALALLFRKVRYTYKLRECLLCQVGYSDGELAADMDDDFEYYMYLIRMQLRRPDRLHCSRTASFADKVDTVVKQAVGAADDWQTHAIANHRPIRTCTSSHTLNYSRVFLRNIGPRGCANVNHPTLEQLRLILLATLIGFNQHHTYDECMVASHGSTHDGVTLEYTDRVGYRDIIDSADAFVRDKVGKPLLEAIIAIGRQFIANFEEHQAVLDPPLPHPGSLVAQWFNDTTGRIFPEAE